MKERLAVDAPHQGRKAVPTLQERVLGEAKEKKALN